MRIRFGALLFVGLLALLPASAALADNQFVLFKDGFVVQGKIQRNMTQLYDASGKSFLIPSSNGFFFVEDGARSILFSPGQVHDAIKVNPNAKKNQILFSQDFARSKNMLPNEFQVNKIGTWNASMQREIIITWSNGNSEPYTKRYTQQMTLISPDFIRVKTIGLEWDQYFLTSELSPETVKESLKPFLLNRLAKKIESRYERTKTVFRFLYQAGLTAEAEKELAFLKTLVGKDSKSSDVDDLLDNLKKEKAANLVNDLEKAAKLGQHGTVREQLQRFEETLKGHANGEALVKVKEIADNYKTTKEQLAEAKRLLEWFTPKVRVGYKGLFKQATTAILHELNQDTVGRLETFLSQAQVFEQTFKKGKATTQTTEEVLSFAVSGWVLGNGAAEENVEAAQKLWAARELLVEYLKTEVAGTRKDLLGQLATRKIPVDQLARALALLPPAEPYEKLDGKQPFKIDCVGNQGQTHQYFVQLPPDYQHVGRNYPVLLVLHHATQKPQDSLKRWRDLAAQYGFILAAPSWGKKAGGVYGYSEREHAAVLDCLRDVRRKFAVDSDRVFLFGCEEGGKAAYDIGLAHPDLFAGVAPMSATPAFYPFRYWSNAMYLPFYVVNGERSGKSSLENKTIFKDWVRYNFPVLYVEYKGRSLEWFEGEPKFIMDWMSRKKRLFPIPQAGVFNNPQQFKTMRPGDNRYYWLGTSEIVAQCLNDPGNWNKLTQPATLCGDIKRDNSIWIRTHGVGNVTVWLGPGMLNYNDKGGETKVKLDVNGTVIFRKVLPSAEILLEHVYQTGDRQRLYWARIDVRI